MSGDSETKHIIQSLAVNVTIAAAKGAAAVFTGSGCHAGRDAAFVG